MAISDVISVRIRGYSRKAAKAFGEMAVAVTIVSLFVYMLGPSSVAFAVANGKPTFDMYPFELKDAYSVINGSPSGAGSFKNGNPGSYPEGACLPVLIEAKNNDVTPTDLDVTVVYDYQNDAVGVEDLLMLGTSLSDPLKDADDLNDFTFGSTPLSGATGFATNLGTDVSASVSSPYSGQSGTTAVSGSDTVRHYDITLHDVPPEATVHVLMCAKLGVDASGFHGASMSVRISDDGKQNIAIQASQLLVLPKLTLRKIVVGGSAKADQWSFVVSPSIGGVSTYHIPTGLDSVTIDNISPDGDYTVTETGPAGYNFSSGSGTNCVFSGDTATASVAADKPAKDASCTFTNVAVVAPKLTVVKTVVNDDGGTAVVSDFPLFVDGDAVVSGTGTEVTAGAHTVSETSSDAYAATFGGDCDANGNVTVGDGESKTCTITNDDRPATLVVKKAVTNDDGGTKTPADFTMLVTGTDVSEASFPGSADGTTVTLDAGAYSVDEADAIGYSKDLGVGCSGTIGNGETVTCTITNDDPPAEPSPSGTLIVVKNVVNDDGGTLLPGNFTIRIGGAKANPSSFLGESGEGTVVTVVEGDYVVNEDGVVGYRADFSEGCAGTITAGETKTCTITNDDVAPKLTVKKLVVHDSDGAKTPADFTMLVTGTGVSSASFPGSADGTTVTLDAGEYSVDEEDSMGYTKTIGAGCSGTIAVGEEKTCTITNEYAGTGETGGTIIVVKEVVNDNGGYLGVSDFPLFVDGQPVVSGEANAVSAGEHFVTETTRDGYVGRFGGDCDSEGSVTVAAGETKTCTITNDDPYNGGGGGEGRTGQLVVTKVVVNDNIGTLTVSDFPLFVDGQSVTSGATSTVAVGTHTVTETTRDGYVGTFSGDCDSSGNVTVSVEGTSVCILTNDDPVYIGPGGGGTSGGGGSSGGDGGGQSGGGGAVTANLTVITHVINDAGGTLVAPEVWLNVIGGETLAAMDVMAIAAMSSSSIQGNESGTSLTLDPGGYGVTVTSVHPGYSVAYGTDCTGTLSAGQSKYCTVVLDQDDSSGSGSGTSTPPAPQVLGESDEVADPADVAPAAPAPQVLGESDELPRTGLPAALLLAPLALGLAWRRREND